MLCLVIDPQPFSSYKGIKNAKNERMGTIPSTRGGDCSGESMTNVAKRLGLTQPAVGYAVDRGLHISKKRQIKLIEQLS